MPSNMEFSTNEKWYNAADEIQSLNQHLNISDQDFNSFKLQQTNKFESNYCYFHGIAQGSPLSPTLSTLVLVPELYLKDNQASTLGYADDGMSKSNTAFSPDEVIAPSRESGISVHNTAPKSKWVKYNGEWLSDLKFLGKKYLPNSLHPPALRRKQCF